MTTHEGRGAEKGLVRRTEAAEAAATETSERSRDTHDRIFRVLAKYMSRPSALATLNRAGQSCGLSGRLLETSAMPTFFAAVEKSATALLDRRTLALLRGELEFELSMTIGAPLVEARISESLTVRSEWDVSLARTRSREMVTALGGRSYEAVKAMTIVSELARNILLYTHGGQIELNSNDDPRSLVVNAIDKGPGIPNLDQILSGRFRSKTGLGRGIIGAKRLANRFDIETGPGGTRIEAEVLLSYPAASHSV